MTGRSLVGRILGILVVVLVLSMVVGQVIGQPILLSYVATGSMEPTMDAGDGFVAIPSAVAGSIDEGDVVVFDAKELHGGGLTTHRVVGETEEGYVTRGDANPFTDQDADEPPVAEGQIVAVALTVGGDVVTIPHLGTALMGIQATIEAGYGWLASAAGLATTLDGEGVGAILVAVGVALLGIGVLFDRLGGADRRTGRSTVRENVVSIRFVIALVLVTFVVVATLSMVLPSGATEYGVVSTDEPTDDPQVLAPGERGEVTRTIDNAGLLPTVVVLEPGSPGVEVEPERVTVGSRGSAEAAVTLTAPASTGEHARYVGEYRYLALLPPSVLAALHGVHPFAAVAAVNAVLVVATVALVLAIFGADDLRLRDGGDDVPLSIKLRRRFRR